MEATDLEVPKRTLREFLERDGNEVNYVEKLKDAISDGTFRLVVNLNDVRNHDGDLASNILRRPQIYVLALQEVITEMAPTIDPSSAKHLQSRQLQVGFDGSFGMNSVSPRGLLSAQLNKLVEVEGIVTKCSNVKPKLIRSVHYNPTTKAYSTREFRDQTGLDVGVAIADSNGAVRQRLPTNAMIPTEDADGNPIDTEHGLCQYKDYQCVTLQEMPERAKVGQLPRSVEVILEYDLVDSVKPGDRVQCVGIYRPLGGSSSGSSSMGTATSGIFKSVLLCNNMKIIGKEVGAVKLTGQDVANIRQISERPDLLRLVSKSLCPSIFGHDYIKTGLILQLLGGVEHNLDNGIHLRGDINVMLVGDPSTAKSQLLRTVLDIAPLAISTSGRGSSGVGLTAAVTSDPETSERKLEAGAMVLADRGIVCIDEFDKMSEVDRVAIHEVMEQQTVTIAKAGIHASLNARCSVLAAANPIYGQYDRNRRPQDNIGLPDSLLSRFDLLFIVLDQFDSSFDRKLSEHVIKSHQYRKPGTTMEPEPLVQSTSSLRLEYAQVAANNNEGSSAADESSIWIRGGARECLKNSETGDDDEANSTSDTLTKEFLRKYLYYAKNRPNPPELSDEAMEHISNNYANMRSQVLMQSRGNVPVTARSLETIIRLSSAHAKLRLSPTVDVIDVEAALVLIQFVLFHEITGNGESEKEKENSLNANNKRELSATVEKHSTESNEEESQDGDKLNKKSRLLMSQETGLTVDILAQTINAIQEKTGSEEVSIDVLAEEIGKVRADVTREEIDHTLSTLQDENRVMVSDGHVLML